jgi:DNA transformation protein
MARQSAFVGHVVDLLSPLGPPGGVRPRAMFGGYGIYLNDLMFALVAWDVLYFKVDDGNRPAYEAAGSGPFRPYADRPTTMSYHEVPASLLDEPDALMSWARDAVAAARRARGAKPSRPRARPARSARKG